jgi:hypothetical protein
MAPVNGQMAPVNGQLAPFNVVGAWVGGVSG